MRRLPANASARKRTGRRWCRPARCRCCCCRPIRTRRRRCRRCSELMVDYPHLEVRFLPDTGQLLFFAEWPQALERGRGDGRDAPVRPEVRKTRIVAKFSAVYRRWGMRGVAAGYARKATVVAAFATERFSSKSFFPSRGGGLLRDHRPAIRSGPPASAADLVAGLTRIKANDTPRM